MSRLNKKDSESNSSGIVFDIQKFCTHDGPGIRTTVFLKGCPLRCLWCHNPESHRAEPELSFFPEKCLGCGRCKEVCPLGESFSVPGADCSGCGLCAEVCPSGAREMIGRTQSANEVLFEVLQDRVFYESSGGGMTLSGGEPMHQFPFAFTLMRSAKHEGLHTCLETCGFAPTEQYRQMFPLTDLFLYDIKETDKDRHQDYTGVPLAPILHNLEVLNEAGAQIILRCPLIPGLNIRDDHFREVGRLAQRLDNVMRVEVEPYHPLGISKSERIGQKYPLPELAHFLPKDRTESCVAAISASCDKPVASLG